MISESIILKQITNYLQLRENLGELYFARVGSGGIKTEQGKFFKSGKRGCPDIIVCYCGKFYGLEVKTEKGKQSEFQKEAETKIKKSYGKYYIVRNLEDVINLFTR